ncbi:galactose-1-phosphate uridylyltransferase [Candidatus Woesearchaeota archaeon]|jgi:UDPglucose--hexose-1-phosphate uridylyltransferase|nr:galactose-1-phosphate uridylyltransferase [Candidatus Woesearchaeota archaeon]
MTELRKDYLLNKFVIISPKRGQRPHQFKHDIVDSNEDEKDAIKKCFFCPGNENKTPEEIYRLNYKDDDKKKKNTWKIRVFPNKFAAVSDGDAEIKTHNEFFTFANATGKHEIVVETSDHKKQLVDLNIEDIVDIFKTYVLRINELEKQENIKYVIVFKNHGKDAGTSIVHSHSQIVAYNIVPTIIKEKEEAVKKYAENAAKNNTEPHCAYCKILNIEKTSDRKVFENNTFVCFTPYASRMPYEVRFMPKRHVISVKELNEEELFDLAELLKKILLKLKNMDASFNFYLHNGTGKERQFHFHIELLPRISKWAGFEFGTNTIINSVTPEDAASYYRE